MKTLTVKALENVLREKRGSQFVTIVAATLPRCLKKDRNTGEPNPHGQVVKISRVNGLIGWHYQNSVNNQRRREGNEEEFSAEPRRWGERILPTPLVEHKGKMFLEVKVEHALGTEYYDGSGNPIRYDDCKGVLPARKGESARQETEKAIILRDYALDGIREISIGGESFRIVA